MEPLLVRYLANLILSSTKMADFQDELLALAGIDDSDVASNRKRAHDDL